MKLFRLVAMLSKHREEVTLSLLDNGERLIDIGCGDGHLLVKAEDKFNELWGIDISSARINRAKSNLVKASRKKFHLLEANFDEKLPLRDNYFDTITCIAAFEAGKNPYHLITEFRRILKPSGTLILQVANIAFLPRRVALLLGKLPVAWQTPGLWNGGALHYFTKESLLSLLKGEGFSIEKITCSGFLPPFRIFWISLLGGDVIIKASKT